MSVKRLRGLLLFPPALMLSGCNLVLLHPAGDVARQQSDLMIASVILMCLIIVPVLIATAVIAWRYRAANKNAEYDPEWDHSTQLELVVWAAPLLIIIVLGAMTWIGTHQLDPYRSLTRIEAGQPVPADVKPLEVEVVSLNWKWLFFYPQYGIATVNELAAPVNTPIHFKLTSTETMNAFFVPSLAGMIYTMPGMETVLNAVINKPGDFDGFSSNYSGHGFTDMRFRFHGLSPQDFSRWVAGVRADGSDLDTAVFDRLNQPSRAEPVHHYARFDADLFHRILNQCVDPGQMCMDKMMAIDAGGHAARGNSTEDAMSGAPSMTAPAHDAATH
ncbi:MAG: ubiquinol oxidase subunit II [Pseudomonadota bacterium]|nr:ubiquinol oxidase subunit II [Xanthomonadaceae bacterium]MDE3209201.1 ubiquinol oxidase subunit II [Pseudomonadota bacterium]